MTERKSGITGLLLAAALILLLAACGRNTQPPAGFGFTGAEAICTDGHLSGLRLSWSESAGATGYEVLRDGATVGTTGEGETSFDDMFATVPTGTVRYVVRADGADGLTETPPFDIDPTALDCGETVIPEPEEPDEPSGPDEPDGPDAPIIVTAGNRLASFEATNLAIDEQGDLWAWGDNDYGLLGQGNFRDYDEPVRISGVEGAVSVALGEEFALALDATGAVYVWGNGYPDVPGLPGTDIQLIPARVNGLPPVVSIAAGEVFALASDEDGNVWAWGDNEYGQLATDPATVDFSVMPMLVESLSDVASVHAGADFAFALHEDGSVSAWGLNRDGQLGLGDFDDRWEPEVVEGLYGVLQLSAGRYHALALTGDGTVLGSGSDYLLNYSGTDNTFMPIEGLGAAKFVVAGMDQSLAVLTDGTAVIWGDDYESAYFAPWLTDETAEPVVVPGVTGAVAVASGYQHQLVLTDDGSVYGWGINRYGSLGSSTPTLVDEFTSVVLPADAADVAAGAKHTLALLTDGTVAAWGDNLYGQLGIGDVPSQSTPALLTGLADIQAVAAGSYFSLALDVAGDVWAWGSNSMGQLGLGGRNDQPEPVQVSALSDIVSIAAGGNTALALDAAGQLWAWGYNSYGQAGVDPAGANSITSPTQVTLDDSVIHMASGRDHTLVLLSDGSVVGFGSNYSGQLGVPSSTFTSSHEPVETGVTGAVAVVAGDSTSYAILEDGSVTAWGSGFSGRLGVGSGGSSNQPPTAIAGLTDVARIATYGGHSLALTGSGELYGWGVLAPCWPEGHARARYETVRDAVKTWR